MVVDRLKSCPFCGGRKLSVTSEEIYNAIMESMEGTDNKGSVISIECCDCNTEVNVYTKPEPYEIAYQRVVNKWNSRVDNPLGAYIKRESEYNDI